MRAASAASGPRSDNLSPLPPGEGQGVRALDRRTGTDGLTNEQMAARLYERFGLVPFACLGSNLDDRDPRWVSFVVAAALGPGERSKPGRAGASAIERLFLVLSRWLRAATRSTSGKIPAGSGCSCCSMR